MCDPRALNQRNVQFLYSSESESTGTGPTYASRSETHNGEKLSASLHLFFVLSA